MNIYFIFMTFGSVLAAISQTLLKFSANKSHVKLRGEYLNFYVILSYSLLALSLLINIYSYRGVPYKYAPVFAAVTYLVSLILAKIILKEEIKDKLWGNLLIVLGILISIADL